MLDIQKTEDELNRKQGEVHHEELTRSSVRMYSHAAEFQDIVHFELPLIDIRRHGAIQEDVVEKVEIIFLVFREVFRGLAVSFEELDTQR